MLWESSDPLQALTQRFGFPTPAAAGAFVAALLADRWRLAGADVEALVISDHNAIVWVRAGDRALIVKIASDPRTFARLAAVADLLGRLASRGVPTPPPVAAVTGEPRTIVEVGDRALSVLVQPLVSGTHLDVTDGEAVRDTGRQLARVHAELAQEPPGPLAIPGRGADRPVRDQLRTGLDRLPAAVAAARSRLTGLADSLPELPGPVQLVHGDVRSANVLVRDRRVTALLDFDEVGLDHRVVELARAAVLLATRFHAWGPAPTSAHRALIEGYDEAAGLSEVEREWLAAVMLRQTLWFVPDGDDPQGWTAAAAALL